MILHLLCYSVFSWLAKVGADVKLSIKTYQLDSLTNPETLGLLETNSLNTVKYFLQPTNFYMQHGTVVDLWDILLPFCTSNCLVHVTNFHNLNLKLNTHHSPIILRTPSLAVLKSQGAPLAIVWSSKNIIDKVNITSDNNKFDCSSSSNKFMLSRLFITGICSYIKFKIFLLNSKPWQCETRLTIFPLQQTPFRFKDTINTYPFVLKFNVIWDYEIVTNPKVSIKSSDVLYTGIKTKGKIYHIIFTKQIAYIQDYRLHIHYSDTNQHITNIVLLVILNNYAKSRVISFQKVCINPYISYGQPMFTCFLTMEWRKKQLNEINYIAEPKAEDFMEWFINDTSEDMKYDFIFSKCQTMSSSLLPRQKRTMDDNLLAKLLVQFLFTLMGNFTFKSSDKTKPLSYCSNRQKGSDNPVVGYIWLEIKHQNSLKPWFYGERIKSQIGSYGFVNCARSFSSMSFELLYNVFDIFIWIGIFCIVIFISIWMHICKARSNRSCIIQDIRDVTAVLVEQCNVFSSYTFNVGHNLVICVYLLIAVVISNAYKSNNITSLISSRKLISFDTFDQILNNNFTIYNKATVRINFWDSSNLPLNSKGLNITAHKVTENLGFHSVLHLQSEVDVIYSTVYNEDLLLTNNTMFRLWNQSKLIPNVISLLKQVQSDYLIGLKKIGTNIFEFNKMMAVKFEKLEASNFKQLLRKCDNIAVVLPIENCRQLKQSIHESVGITVGKDFISENNVVLEFKGTITSHLSKRLKSVQHAGVWDWLGKILSIYNVRESKDQNRSRKPSISGNISVLFSVLILGQLIALCCFGIEMGCTILPKIMFRVRILSIRCI